MARPRKPLALAILDGSAAKRPARYGTIGVGSELGPLGPAPDWLRDTASGKARSAWNQISLMAPWLTYSHRGITSIAATVLGKVMVGGEVGVQALNLLRQCYGQMGLTPADAGRVPKPVIEEESEFFS